MPRPIQRKTAASRAPDTSGPTPLTNRVQEAFSKNEQQKLESLSRHRDTSE
jgi:hypothetical protein